MLKLIVKSANDLIDVDFGPSNKSDPYVKAVFRGEERKTDYIKDELNPVWTAEHNNEFVWDLGADPILMSDEIQVKVRDWEKIFQKRLLGQVVISLKDLLKTKSYSIEESFTLLDSYNRPLLSTILLRIEYIPSERTLMYMSDDALDKVDEIQDEDEETEEDEKDERGNRIRKKRQKTQIRKVRREWSTIKRHYKITIKIHEGRQLLGANLSPVARVTVKNQKHETRVKKSTNSPKFNQTFTFNFHCSEAELFEELIVLEVFNSRKIFKNSLIGFFESEIGTIYEFPDHAIIRKWVLLTGSGLQEDDDDESNGLSKWLRRRGRDGGTAGYLKVTINVIASGDEPLSLKQLGAKIDDEDDIEANCLIAPGVTRESAEFRLKVYLAEDLPRMDAGYISSLRKLFLPGRGQDDPNEIKKLVDPFVVFSFSGKEVRTSTKYKQNNPTFNELLKLPLMYPTMCERLKFQLYDKDRGVNKNDIIGTSFLSLSEISGKNNSSAFLPHFGPCYINFYGAPREYHVFRSKEFDAMNKGIGEGAAFRGRLLVELTQEKNIGGSRPSVHKVHPEDVVRVQPFLRQEKYKMFACFKNAAMISQIDKAIEFEVSIGNFGNTLDETEVSCNTPPTNPVYDGSHYHYLPWHHYKPCICLNCNWENITFRIDPLNIINNMCEQLDSMIRKLKNDLEEVKEQDTRIVLVRDGIQDIIEKCRINTKFLNLPGQKNSLDLRLSKLRQDEFAYITQDAIEWINKLDAQKQPVNVDLDKIIEDMDDYVARLRSLAFEPQISIPDVIIWMLCGGSRIAYHRIPIQDVIYSPNKDACGKYCGKTIELLMKYPGKTQFDKEYHEVPAMVRVELWVGLREYQQKWTERDAQKGEGKFEIYAETYENEIRTPILGWSKPRLNLRPHYSNASGDVPLHKKKFVVTSKDWDFKDDTWKVVMDKSLLYDRDWGLRHYTDEIYEHQSRNLLGGEWNEKSTWTEEDGQPSRGVKDFPVREGWRWTMDNWGIDVDRAVDGDGWEYCVSEGLGGTYVKAGKPLHMTRRRRRYRTRDLVEVSDEMPKDLERIQELDEDGWEYAASFQSKFHITRRTRDFVRRKRLFRQIVQMGIGAIDLPPKLVINTKIKHKTKKEKKQKDKSDHEIDEQDSKEEERKGLLTVLPRMFVVYEKSRRFQLWVYIYQARDLLPMDDSGTSDPYVRVAFCNQSQKTEWVPKTLSPKWDQTLVFPQVEIFETLEAVVRNPPNIIMEVFDRDPVKHDFIGRCMIQPVVQTQEVESSATLTWVTLYNGQANAGQILVTAELFLDEGQQRLPAYPRPKPSKSSGYIYPVRTYIRPELQTVAVEILCWGVRNMEKYNHRSVDHPSVEFEWGNGVFLSDILENAKKNPNFAKPNLTRKIVTLEEEPYTPAMSVKVYDNRSFRQKPLVGVISISTFEMSQLQPLSETSDFEEPVSPYAQTRVTRSRAIEQHKKEREEFDWWSKYQYSLSRTTRKRIKTQSKMLGMFTSEDAKAKDHLDIYEEKKYDSLEIYQCELENVKKFEGLNDFVSTLKLKRGKWKGEEEDEDDIVGELKASIRVYQVDEESKDKLPRGVFDDLSELKMKWPIKCVVRVYVICAFDLQPHDPSGLADPYLVVSLGDKTKDDKENCLHNTLEPQFGKMFEFNASIPLAKDLKITVMDSDPGFDDLIGETTIDLEQRLLSRFHACCGLSKTYLVDGPFAWRDSLRPKEILRMFCLAKGYHPYFYPKGQTPNTLVLKVKPSRPESRDLTFKLSDIEDYDPDRKDAGSVDQQLSLYALHCLGLVPEHVETRSLYSPLQPGIEQGKLHLWVDVFPKTGNAEIQPPIDITPRLPKPYVLRVIIWDTTGVILQEKSITGEKMSDIYVKGWIQDIDEKQKTDIHYRSLDGDGNFNWRMSFPLMIMPIERQLVISKKEKFYHRHETMQKVDPILKIQIWENDKFSPDDFLGTRSLHLNDLVRPCKSSKYCGTKNDPDLRRDRSNDFVDLFHGDSKSIRGWFACWKDENQKTEKPTGKVDMSIEILTEAQAKLRPVGLGREEPNQHPHLPEPDRPKTSFLWFTSPFKSIRYIVWRNYKWYFIGLIITILLVLIILLFVYNVPGYSVKKLFGV